MGAIYTNTTNVKMPPWVWPPALWFGLNALTWKFTLDHPLAPLVMLLYAENLVQNPSDYSVLRDAMGSLGHGEAPPDFGRIGPRPTSVKYLAESRYSLEEG